ncbi:hypothetical protein ACI65C_010493 [Semiaphis heraclei]
MAAVLEDPNPIHGHLSNGSRIQKEEFVNILDTEVNIEKDIIDGNQIISSVSVINHWAELIARLNSDKKLNLKRKRFGCDICGKFFYNKNQVRSHILHCYSAKKEKKSISKHKQKQTAKNKCITQCSVCDKTFTKKSSLPGHMRIHSGYKPHKCNICDKAFSRRLI